jgi:aminoglycoside/choline kinase family phosphotransferase
MTMVDHTLGARLGKCLGEKVRVERLPGDASDRTFYRVHRPAGQPAFVLMAQKGPLEPDDSPFCQMQGLLEGIGLPVPRIERLFPEDGWILMADVGRSTLQEYLLHNGPGTAPRAYHRAVEILLTLQVRGTPELPADFHGARTRLDREKFAWELQFTWTHLLEGLYRRRLPDRESDLLKGWADEIGGRLEKTEQVLCHRDYHSRNLMWDGETMGVVDFQDTRIGPCAYDLASLLQDPYVDLEEDLKEEMLWKFLEGRGFGKAREAQIRDQLDLAIVQRCLKAAGTYAFQVTTRGRNDFLAYIGPALRNALRALRRFPEYDAVLRLLERYRAEAASS